MVRTRSLALVLATTLLLVGCAAGNREVPMPTAASPTKQASTDTPLGQWGEIGIDSAGLSLLEDGTLTGSDGCIGFEGKWVLTDGVVQFSELVGPSILCEPGAYLIGQISSAIIEGDTIRILDDEGNASGMLPRVPAD